MASMNPGAEVITLVRAPLVRDTRSGQYIRDWSQATETVIHGCSVQAFPLAEKLNKESTVDREFALSSVRVYAPAGSAVPEPTDRFLYRGRTYEIFGFAAEWTDLEGKLDHVAYVARIKEG